MTTLHVDREIGELTRRYGKKLLAKAAYRWKTEHGAETAQGMMALTLLHLLLAAIRGLGDPHAAWEVVKERGDTLLADKASGSPAEEMRAPNA